MKNIEKYFKPSAAQRHRVKVLVINIRYLFIFIALIN